MRKCGPVGLANFDSMPRQAGRAEEPVEAYALAFNRRTSQTAARVDQCDEPVNICMLRYQSPIEPAGFIVLTIGIVVSELRPPHLIAHEDHRYPRSQHRYG